MHAAVAIYARPFARAHTHIRTFVQSTDKKRQESICKMLERNERHSDVLLFTLFFIFRTQFHFFLHFLFFQFESFMQYNRTATFFLFFWQIVFLCCFLKRGGNFLSAFEKNCYKNVKSHTSRAKKWRKTKWMYEM